MVEDIRFAQIGTSNFYRNAMAHVLPRDQARIIYIDEPREWLPVHPNRLPRLATTVINHESLHRALNAFAEHKYVDELDADRLNHALDQFVIKLPSDKSHKQRRIIKRLLK